MKKSVGVIEKMAIRALFTLDILEKEKSIKTENLEIAILGLLSTIKDYNEDDFQLKEDGKRYIKEDSASGYIVNRLIDAHNEDRLRKQYIEELKSEEKYELLAKIV